MSKTLILIRHAHRDTEDPARDNGLSEKGRGQVLELVHHFKYWIEREHPKAKIKCFSSPKKRCVQTLTPIAEKLDLGVEIDSRLTEVSPMESRQQVEARLESFLEDWKAKSAELTLVCSHGDFIPLCVQMLTGARIGIKKAGIVQIEGVSGEYFLTALIQKV
jgi:broad specificity phosphatase PhoE